MSEQFLNQIGEWNPQLIREIKCRVNRTSLVIATAVSLLAQAVPFLFTNGLSEKILTYGWLNIYQFLGREIWFSLVIGGTYLIAADFNREIRSGTLDLVNLSPIKPGQYVLGKLLGVPILIYWAVTLALPLYAIVVCQIASIDPNILAWGLISLSTIGLLYLNAIYATIKFSLPPIILSISLTAIGLLLLSIANIAGIGRQKLGDYNLFGLHFHEQWWTLSILLVTVITISSTLSSIIQSWYGRSKCQQIRSRWLMAFSYYSCLLLVYIFLVGLTPLAIVVMLLFFRWIFTIFKPSI